MERTMTDPNAAHDWDTGLYGACGACGALVVGDPVYGAFLGAVVAMGVRRILIPWGVALLEAAADRLRSPPKPPGLGG